MKMMFAIIVFVLSKLTLDLFYLKMLSNALKQRAGQLDLRMAMGQQCKLYVLVGVPGSGKSTWIDAQDWALTCARISTDKWVEIYAQEVGKTYSEVFADFMPTAVDLMAKEVVVARELKRDIIWDQTSTTVESRKKKLRMIPDSYEKIAVVIKTPDSGELSHRLANRPGKVIPGHVMKSMIAGWQEPEFSEGFDEIIHV
jgi:predicted kinase